MKSPVWSGAEILRVGWASEIHRKPQTGWQKTVFDHGMFTTYELVQDFATSTQLRPFISYNWLYMGLYIL